MVNLKARSLLLAVGLGMTRDIHKWKLNDWTLPTGGLIKDRADFQRLDSMSRDLEVTWVRKSESLL